MPTPSRRRQMAFAALATLLVLTSVGCKKKGGDGAEATQEGRTEPTTATTTATTATIADGPWTGKVVTDFRHTYTPGSQSEVPTVHSGSITYTELVPLPRGQAERYSAMTSGAGGLQESGYCPVTAGFTTIVHTWTASGRDPNNNGEGLPSLTIADFVDPDTGLPTGTTITPHHLALVANAHNPCGGAPDQSLNSLVGGFQFGHSQTPTHPVPDTDPDPGHLAGSVTYTVAVPPYGLPVEPDEYRYTITYDLRRQAPPEPCPERHFSRVEYGAGFPEGDLFSFYAAVKWCVGKQGIEVLPPLDGTRNLFPDGLTGSQGAWTVALESYLGIEFQEKAGDETHLVEPRSADLTEVTIGTPGFEACASPVDILLAAPPVKALIGSAGWSKLTLSQRQALLRNTKDMFSLPAVLLKPFPNGAVANDLFIMILTTAITVFAAQEIDTIDALDSATDVCVDVWTPAVHFLLHGDGTESVRVEYHGGSIASSTHKRPL